MLAAVATRAAIELTAAMRAAADAAGRDPVDRLAATAGAYVRFGAARGAGFDVIFAADLRRLHDTALAEAGRDLMAPLLMALLLDLAREAGYVDPEAALRRLEQLIALAHGYAALDNDGFLTGGHLSDVDVATRATNGAAALLRPGASPAVQRRASAPGSR